jgi:hypothetical protein
VGGNAGVHVTGRPLGEHRDLLKVDEEKPEVTQASDRVDVATELEPPTPDDEPLPPSGQTEIATIGHGFM